MNIRITAAATICLLTLSMTAVAQDASGLTIAEALAAAQDANPALASLALQRENARVAFDRASASSDARLDQVAARLQWERAQLTVGQGTTRELLAIAQGYVSLQQANEQVSLLEERLRLATLDLELTDARVRVGAAGKTEQLQAQVAALSAELNLAAARQQRRFNTLPNLVDMTGIDAATLDAAALTSEPPDLPDLGASDTYAAATARRAEHRHAAQQLELDEINLKLVSEEETSRLDREAATNTVAGSKAALEDTAVNLQTATASAYATAQQAFQTVTLRELQLALQQERTRRAAEQYDAGVITESGLAGSHADQVAAVDAVRAARWSAWFAWLRLQDAAGIDLPPIPGVQ
ncbi:MAG: TolC family protein [Spirochaetaceae bacterium]|nr:TolC family protein [Spirochaetaceae bacterium]